MRVDDRTPETIFPADNAHNYAITGEVVRDDPGNPVVRLECGCNEFWLDRDEASAVILYLYRKLSELDRSGENG